MQDSAPASDPALAIADEWGIDLRAHRARRLTEQMVREADLICTMTEAQARTVRSRFPAAEGKIYSLASFVSCPATSTEADDKLAALMDGLGQQPLRNSTDILDPFGGSLEAYQTCAAQIRRAVLGLAAALREGRFSIKD